MDSSIVLKIADDLDNVVSLTNSFLDEATCNLCPDCLCECNEMLDKISDLNGHLDNYAESLHIAADETCSVLLANLARNVIASSVLTA